MNHGVPGPRSCTEHGVVRTNKLHRLRSFRDQDVAWAMVVHGPRKLMEKGVKLTNESNEPKSKLARNTT